MRVRRIDVLVTTLLVAAIEVLLFAAVIVTAVGPSAGSWVGTNAGSARPPGIPAAGAVGFDRMRRAYDAPDRVPGGGGAVR